MESVWLLAAAVTCGFGARIGWGAAQGLGDLIDAFFAGYMRGRAARQEARDDK